MYSLSALFLCVSTACGTAPESPISVSATESNDFGPTQPDDNAAVRTDPGIESTVTATAAASESGTATPESTSSDACTDNLTFLGDLTFPDKSFVLPGQALEKRWRVRNSGSCDWGPGYRLRWLDGTALSALKETALYPAAAGSEAVILLALTAPLAPGEYVSDWRAVSPPGAAFGDTLYIDILVTP
jgi:hypothetical protein